MIDVANHDRVEEKGTEASDATNLAWEIESERHPGTSLEWYLMKLLEPTEDAPHEEVPQPLEARHREQQNAAEAPKESKPLWQTADEGPSKTQADMGAGRVAKPKSAIRSYAQRERASGGRQKLMIALIPVLAIVMVVLLKNPLGMRSTAKAAGKPATETIHPVIPNAEIAWEIPALYEPSGRDPMRLTPPPAAVVVENAETTARPTEPPVDLVVTGILYSEDKPSAIVDTQVVHEGQQISGATVVKIDVDGVQFERNGRTWKQTVNK